MVKSESRREPFEREKLLRSIGIAARKRPLDTLAIERLVSGIQRQLETSGEAEVTSKRIGEMVMDGLKGLDSVAYIRFASVYRSFESLADFEAEIAALRAERELEGDGPPGRALAPA